MSDSEFIFSNFYDTASTTMDNLNRFIDKSINGNSDIINIVNTIPKYYIIIYIFIGLLIFSVVSKLNVEIKHIMIFLIAYVVIGYLFKNNFFQFNNFITDYNNKLKFINKFMFNTEFVSNISNNNINILPATSRKKSYFYLNPLLIDFFYDSRQFVVYNVSSFVNTLIHCNNILGLCYQMKNNIDKSWNNYNIVKIEMEKALNEYSSIIYNVPLGSLSQDNLKDYTDELQKILQNEVHQLDILFKNENKVKELNIYSRPDDFYNVVHTINPDDTTAKNYMPNYSLY